MTPSWVVRLSSHMGAEKHPTVGSSGEYWSMNESLNQHFAYDERLIISREGYDSCKVCPRAKKLILCLLESRAKKVPAAAVIP
jgi:hypothetical protein